MAALGGKSNAWSRARDLAARTPDTRNRYVDFLRAASIIVVVLGHWLMAAPSMEGGAFSLSDMLHAAPWSQWLTWIFQVMPIFFVVGGYSNCASWDAARRSGQGYGAWIASRVQRLLAPVVPLLVVWSVLAVVGRLLGASPGMIQLGSQVALIPTWFLAVYVMVVVAAPAASLAWERLGTASFWLPALGAIVVDAVAFGADQAWLRWANHAFVWLAVHQIGYLWRHGRLAGTARAFGWAVGGLAALLFLVLVARYPVSMISVPGEEISNSRPPTVALLALGVFHTGLILAIESRVRAWLERPRLWTATVLANATIMTLFLWHATALVLLVGVAYALGGVGLRLSPGSGVWWAARPLWIGASAALLWVFVAFLGRFEQRPRGAADRALPAWRGVLGAMAGCTGLTSLALGGIWGSGLLGLRLWAVLVVVAGTALVLVAPPARVRARTS